MADVLPFAKGGPLECAFGRDSEGKPIVADLAVFSSLAGSRRHWSLAASSCSTPLSCLCSCAQILSRPRLTMVDPKRVEFLRVTLAFTQRSSCYRAKAGRKCASVGRHRWSAALRYLNTTKCVTLRRTTEMLMAISTDMENPPKHMPLCHCHRRAC